MAIKWIERANHRLYSARPGIQIKLHIGMLPWVLCIAVLAFPETLLSSGKKIHNSYNHQFSRNNLTFHKQPDNFNFRAIRTIIRDHKGFMWFGTENGLIRYDGINQTVYEHNPENPQSISANTINILFEDKNQKLWIGTSQGLVYYNRIHDNFGKIDPRSYASYLLNQSYISSISHANDSILWIGTFSQGLFSLNTISEQATRYTLVAEDGSIVNITCLLADTNNLLWVGTQSGLVLFNPVSGQTNWFYNEKNNQRSISNNNITAIQKDKFGNIWIGTQGGGVNLLSKVNNAILFERINSSSDKVRISSNAINKLLADDYGYLWIGTENDGLHLLNIQSGKVDVYTYETGNDKSIGSNSIWSIYRDIEGRVWIGSYNKGISVYDPYHSKFEGFQKNPLAKIGMPSNDIRGFSESIDGKIWIATDGGGICRFDLKTHVYDKIITAGNNHNSLTSNSIQAIITDSDKNIWIGSWGGGIDRLTRNGKFLKNYKIEIDNGVGNNQIRTLYQDKRGNIWAGTNGSGLFIYNKTNDKFEPFGYRDLLNDRSYVVAINSDAKHNLWVGTLEGLISLELNHHNKVLKSKAFTTENSGISSNAISNLFIDTHNHIWIGTTNGGLNIFNPADESFNILRKRDGLPGNNISCVLEDNTGNIWVSTNNGISKIDKTTSEIVNFSMADGLNSNEFYSKSCFKTKDGILLFGSDKGFNLIQPGKIKTNPHTPNILLTGLKINNITVEIASEGSPLKKQLSETKTLVLNYNQSSFSIDFVALNYTRPEKNQFAYKLEGFDKEWNYIGAKTTAYYTKVKPGSYTFRVKGSNNDNIWSYQEAKLDIVIKPPFWKTRWAYFIYMLLVFAIIALIFNIWQERINIKNQLKFERKSKIQEQELKIKNLEYFTNISHEIRTPLSLIIGPLESIIESAPEDMLDILQVIKRNSQRLLSLTNNLLDLRKLEDGAIKLNTSEVDIIETTNAVTEFFTAHIKKTNINLSVDYPERKTIFCIDNEKYTTILFNLLSNAIKYTPENGLINISVKHHAADNLLKISILNTGIGIKQSELPKVFDKFYQADSGRTNRQFGSGIGLAICKGLVELHGGKIWASSIPGKETVFTFTILLNPNTPALEKDTENKPIQISDLYLDNYENEKTSQNISIHDDERPIILIVEDNSELRLFLKSELEKDYSIALASNGSEGLEIANKIIPDIIISDIVMPVMNGIEFCRAIKEDVNTSHIPFVMLTAKTTSNEQIEGLDTGADAYLIKPFDLKLLQSQVANLINIRKNLYARFSQDVYIMSRKTTDNDIDQIFIKKTIDFIIENITDSKLSIENLSAHHNMSHRNFYRKIKALTGNSVVEFIKVVRLKQAVKLMGSHQHNLSEIAYMTGFTSPSYFTKNFREFYGKPPSDFINK